MQTNPRERKSELGLIRFARALVFAEHYLGEITPEAQQRERSKIDYVGGNPEEDTVPFNPRTSAAQEAYGKR